MQNYSAGKDLAALHGLLLERWQQTTASTGRIFDYEVSRDFSLQDTKPAQNFKARLSCTSLGDVALVIVPRGEPSVQVRFG